MHPRWHNQAYIMLLALRQHPTHEMARTDLIKAALDLDIKISRERGLPKVFNGKVIELSICLRDHSVSLKTYPLFVFWIFRPQ